MTTKQRELYNLLLDDFLSKQGDPEKISSYNTKKRTLNKLGKLSVESRKESKMENSRIIKFRAWDKLEKIMYHPVKMEFNRDGVIHQISYPLEGCAHAMEHLEECLFSLMQYTGLKDKNGVEIYEGDIIKHHEADEPEDLGFIIHWVDYKYCLENVRTSQYIEIDMDYIRSIEVIGNIYQNPELCNL